MSTANDPFVIMAGATFDLEVKPQAGVALESLDSDFITGEIGPVPVRVYTRPGGYAGHTSSTDGWTLQASATVQLSDTYQVGNVPLDLHLPQGTWGVAVVVDAQASAAGLHVSGETTSTFEDDSLVITTGGSWMHPVFTSLFFEDYQWSGTIHYDDAPQTMIDSGPSGLTSAAPASFTYSSVGDVADRFECALTSGEETPAFTDCATTGQTYADLADGEYTFAVRAVDASGNTDPSPATRTFTVDATAPTTTITDGPEGLTNENSASFTYAGAPADDVEGFACALTAAGGTPEFSDCDAAGQTYADLADGEYTFAVRAYDAAGNHDPNPATRSFTVDTTAPTVAITDGPAEFTNQTSVSFSYTGEPADDVDRFECALTPAGGTTAFTDCDADGRTYTGLDDVAYTFAVRAYDAAGNRSAPATRAFTVKTTAPSVMITSGPSGPTNATTISFEYRGQPDGEVTGYECSLTRLWNEAQFTACDADRFTVTGLQDGEYTFAVRSLDAAGNVSTPSVRTFTVDTVAPDVFLLTGPAGSVNTPDVSFTYAGSPPNDVDGFECALNLSSGTPEFVACDADGTSYTDLPDGIYDFRVRATDAAGNVSVPAQSVFVVDTIAPTITMTGGPDGPTNDPRPTFTFVAEVLTDVVRFDCAIIHPLETREDGDCGFTKSGVTRYSAPFLDDGSYTFSVTAIDNAGNRSTPATRDFTVDTVAPEVSITGGPSGPSNENAATFTYTGEPADDVEGFECALTFGDYAPEFSACESDGVTYTGLADDDYTFTVRATDAAGNVSETTSRTFTVDTVAPVVSITGGPSGLTSDDAATFTYDGEPTADVAGFKCALTSGDDAAEFADCEADGVTYTGLVDGDYTFTVRALDAAGNASDPATRSFTVDATAPEVSITDGPSGLTDQDSATFTYDGEPTDDVAGFECALASGDDAPEFAACEADGVTYSGLVDGDYTFTVRALDAAGNVSESASRDFTVNTVLPSIGGDTEAAATVGEPFTYTPTIASAHPVTVTTDDDLPAGLELDPASGAITGTPIDTAGTWPITLTATNTNGSNTHTLELALEAGAVEEIAVEPSATEVDQGDSITLNVTGIDVAGNTTPDIDPADLEVTSDVDTDVIDGLTVTFPTASPHTITVTHLPSTATDSIVIDVTPAQTPAPGGTDAPAGTDTGTGDGQQTDHATGNRGDLPSTGTDWTLQAAIYALLALVLGVAIIALTTRRHDTDH